VAGVDVEGGGESDFKIVGCSVGSIESTRLGEIASDSNPLSSDWEIVGRSEGLGVSTRSGEIASNSNPLSSDWEIVGRNEGLGVSTSSGEIAGDSNRLPEAAMLAQLDLGSKALELSPLD